MTCCSLLQAPTHPVYNICPEKVAQAVQHFLRLPVPDVNKQPAASAGDRPEDSASTSGSADHQSQLVLRRDVTARGTCQLLGKGLEPANSGQVCRRQARRSGSRVDPQQKRGLEFRSSLPELKVDSRFWTASHSAEFLLAMPLVFIV